MTGGKPSFAASAKIRAHQRASQQGSVASMLAIGDAYYYGRGLMRDWPMAFQVYAAASRFRNAQVHLAIYIYIYFYFIYIYIYISFLFFYTYIFIYYCKVWKAFRFCVLSIFDKREGNKHVKLPHQDDSA
jgi:hypothetical protein